MRSPFWRRVIALVLPERCAFCGRVIVPMTTVCETCCETLSVIKAPICTYCGSAKADCDCSKHRSAFDTLAAPFYYTGAAKDGVLRLKREDDRLAIAYFAAQMCAVVQREYDITAIDGVTFVPMTARARRKREFNQSERLAREVARRLELPLYDALVKCYETPSQKSRGFGARSGNVLGVFDVRDRTVHGKTLLLVDDVSTTDATLHECAKILKIYGAERVLCVTIAVRKREKATNDQ